MSTAQDSSEKPIHWHYSEFDDRNFQIGGNTLFSVLLVFSAIIAVALLVLLTRWLRRRFRTLPPISDPESHAPPRSVKGLDSADVSRIPIALYRSSGAGAECPICLGAFEDGEKVKVLPDCQHCYHSECVDRWLVARPSCPMCRTSLRVDSVVIVTE